MTRKIKIKAINFCEGTSPEKVSSALDKLTSLHSVDSLSWKEFPYKPNVKFKAAYNAGDLFIKYYVEEKYIRAVNANTNGNVWEDSCVEFFLDTGEDGDYFNFEVNCIGTCLVQKGKNRENRKYLDLAEINRIKRLSSLGNSPFQEKKGNFKWSMTLIIPLASICGIKYDSLKGLKMKGNFYMKGFDYYGEDHKFYV
jgi:hypothetical protein